MFTSDNWINLSTQRYLPGFTRYSSLLAFVRFVTIISEWWVRKKSLPCGNVLKGVIGTRSARIEFWMHLNSLFNKCRRTVILIPTKLCQDEQNKKSTAVLLRSRTDFVSTQTLVDYHIPSWYLLGCFSLNKMPEISITRTILMIWPEPLEHIDKGFLIFGIFKFFLV